MIFFAVRYSLIEIYVIRTLDIPKYRFPYTKTKKQKKNSMFMIILE